MNDTDSSSPPSRAPIRFDPRACDLSDATANERMKINPAKNTGAVRNALAATSLVEPVKALNQSSGTSANAATVTDNPAVINHWGKRGHRHATRLASRIMMSTAEMTMALTIQVMPKSSVARLTVCTSRSRKAAPNAKKCQLNPAATPSVRRLAANTEIRIEMETIQWSLGIPAC